MKEDPLDILIHRLFEGELSAADESVLNRILKESPAARSAYFRATSLHSALSRLAAAEQALPAFSPPNIDLSDEAYRSKTTVPYPWLALAACLALLLGAAWFWPRAQAAQLAVVSETRDLVWKKGSPSLLSGAVPKDQSLELLQGCLRLTYPTGATVTLEGPCRFLVNSPEAISVAHGRVSVHAPPGAQGFVVDTPGGRFVDLGTEFGLAVGSDGERPVVLTEVFKGELEVQATRQPTRLVKGESRVLVQDTGLPTLLSSLDDSPINLVNHALDLPPAASAEPDTNLALNKPVTSPAFYVSKHGSVFPPDRLTDGRLDDSGVPGDWSFWLAPNEENGEFTVDLLRAETIGRVSLQNTNNRRIGDRGVSLFEVYGSLDNREFTLLTTGNLPRIDTELGNTFPFHDFAFAAQQVRYVRVVVTGHYRHPLRSPQRKDHGGGLNEIRIFAP